ncbi:hypothetical protein ACTNEN_09575 [Oribacterium sp. HCP28S3_H8]|uniref:hypothetical protein n=1 Tax=Oribacterium sp. HCP28S3_H8 TaxID=3438945 RepID=UPI003F8C05ED
MLAIKGNREYNVSDVNQKMYQDSGYDIYDDSGKLIAYGRGKTVPYEDFAKLQAENDALKKSAVSKK